MSEKASIGKVSRVNIAMIHTYINKIIAYLNFGTEIDEENFGDSLVCKKCGHKQRNDETISEFMSLSDPLLSIEGGGAK